MLSIQKFIEMFPHYTTKYVAEYFGITENQANYLARKYNLRKTPEHLEKYGGRFKKGQLSVEKQKLTELRSEEKTVSWYRYNKLKQANTKLKQQIKELKRQIKELNNTLNPPQKQRVKTTLVNKYKNRGLTPAEIKKLTKR